MIKSQTIQYKDFASDWYAKWATHLKHPYQPGKAVHNKAWQNAIILQVLHEREYLQKGNKALGFGVGTERIPSALAALGVTVTATDQDFKSGKEGGWDNGQITRTRNDLNQYDIASKKAFDENVEFENCDMNKIPKAFNGKYDVVWSNCALGHLGTIDKGLKFIERSLSCLKPGGIAVHTTETNVVSNKDTIESGGTVIFRRRDLANLFHKLRRQGYECEPLHLDLGTASEDKQFSFYPFEGDAVLKLSAGGYLLSQMVIIIRKPPVLRSQRSATLKKKAEEMLNSRRMKAYIKANPELQEYIGKQKPMITAGIKPEKKVTRLDLKTNEICSLRLKFTNISDRSYYSIDKIFYSGNPLMIATSEPVNRASQIATKSWLSPSRRNPVITQAKEVPEWGGVKPGSTFWAEIEVKAPAKPGKYIENFCFVLEGLPAIPDSEFTLKLWVEK